MADDLDAYADSLIQEHNSKLKVTATQAVAVNPDTAVVEAQLAKRFGMTQQVVRQMGAPLQNEAKADELMATTEGAPKLRSLYSDLSFAEQAHDDAKPLATLEGALNFGKNLGKSVRAALPGASAGIVGAAEMFGDITEGMNVFSYLPQPDYVTRERQAVKRDITGYRKYLEASAAQIRPVGAPGLEAGIYSGVESLTRNVINLPLLFMPGGQQAYLGAMVAPVAGSSYTQAKDQGLNLLQSLSFATAQAGTEYLTELIPAGDLLKNLKAGTPALKTFLQNMVQEQVGEQVATAVQDFNEWAILPENADKPFSEYLKERPNAAFETAVATAIGSGGQVAVATTANAVMQRMQGRQQDAQDANDTAQALDRVAEFAQASKLRERSPETFKDYVREVSQDGPVQDVYVSGEVLNQVLEAQGVTREDLEAASPSIAEQLVTAVATGGDVRIPVEDFATHLSTPEFYQGLADHLKTEPEGMTRAEADEYLQANVETMRAEFDKALASKQGDEAFKASATKVEADILASLETAGRFTPDVNQQYATLASKVLAVQAARVGITPEEMHARYPVSFAARGGTVGGAIMDQPMTTPPVDESGMVTLHHWSSKGGIKTLDPAKWGKNNELLPPSERAAAANEEAPRRTSYGIAVGQPGGYVPEFGLGEHRYTAKIPAKELYDFRTDPNGLRAKAEAYIQDEEGVEPDEPEYASLVNERLETEVKNAGFNGYWMAHPDLGLVAQVFKKIKPTYEGTDDGSLSTLEQQTGAGEVRNAAGVSGGAGVLDGAPGPRLGDNEPLIGLPSPIKVDGKSVKFGAFAPAREAARAYAEKAGIPYNPPVTYAKVDAERATRIADAFTAMEHNPNDPQVKASYGAMIAETLAQWETIKATGLKVEFIQGEDPYGNPRNAILDVVQNNHLWVYPTEAGFGGAESADVDISGNPLLQIVEGETLSGQQVRANDIFRIVHDYFGHIKDGVGFRADGEENAWRSHAAMYSDLARPAMTTETRGQNSWVNFGPFAEFNRTANGAKTEYAPQKIGLLPAWVMTEGATDEAGVYNQTATTPVFFSALARAVENSPTKSATAEQWKATLLKTPGVKQEEMQWTGLFDLFSDPKEKIDREEILAFLRSNGVQLGEVLQETLQLNTGSIFYGNAVANAIDGARTREEMILQLENSSSAYRVLRDREELQYDNEDESGLVEGWAEIVVDDLINGSELSNNPVQFSEYKMAGADDSYKELLLTLPAVQGPSTHWEEDNVVAHARITERTGLGGERVLFLEEVQSDWHQKGRDQGYADESAPEKLEAARLAYNMANDHRFEAEQLYVSLVRQAVLDRADALDAAVKEAFLEKNGRLPNEDEDYFGKDQGQYARLKAELLDVETPRRKVPEADRIRSDFNLRDEDIKLARDEVSRTALAMQEAYQQVSNVTYGIPDAPFRKTWAALTMKRLLRYAVDNGFSKVAWINGDQQNGGRTGGDGSFFYERNLVNVTNDLIKKYGTKAEKNVRMEGINGKMLEPEALLAARGRFARAYNALSARGITFKDVLNGAQELRDRAAELRVAVPPASLPPEIAADTQAQYLKRAHILEASIPLWQEWMDARAALTEAEKDTTREWAEPANYGFTITPELAAFASGGMPLFQGQEARGTYNPGTHQIALNKNADLSTALHELGHFHLEVLADLASKPDAPAEIVADMNTVLSWFGEDMTLDSWGAMTLDQKRPFHEKFARGFEAYLFEGKAPTEELRGIFQRFRSWLLAVYRDISKLNIELSDEVRSVFDRLVASNEEIVAAQEARAYAPLFDTKPPFMSDEDWIAYQRADPTATQEAIDTLQTRSLRDMRWLANAKARALRELQAASRDARKAVKAEVTAEVMAEKVNVARTFLRTGLDQDGGKVEGPHKLDRAAVTAMYADMPAELVDLSALGKGRYGMMADNGLHPDIAAEALGYGSGSELVEDLLNAESPTDKINGMTDQRMLERYGDLTDNDAMARAADEAVHNDARLRFVATELSALEKATGGRKLMASAARGFAKEMVSRLLLRNLRPAQYTAAETRAGRAADKALKDGDLVAAATQKRNQLINAHSARAVYKAKAEVEKGMNLFKRIVSAKDETLSRNRNMDLVNASRAILAVYGIGRAKNTPAAYMEKIARYDPVLYADLKLFVDAATQDVPKSGDIRDISLEQFIGLRDTVNQMWTMAKRVKEIEIDGKREALSDVTDTLKDALLVKGVGKFAGMGTQRAVTEGEKKLIGFLGAVALLRRVEEWSKMQGAPFERYIYGLVQTSAEKYRAAKIDILPRYRAMLAEIETDLKPAKIYSPELNYTFGEGNGGIGLAELLGALRHTGNESNLTKLLVGRGWGQFQADGTLDTSAWDAFLNRMMDEGMLKERHFDFIQAEWDLHEEIKPLAQKAHHDVYGRYFNEVTANPFTNRFGSYGGGYVAASPDTLLVSEAAQRADAEALFGGGSALFPAPASGFTKGRIENYTVPLALDLRLAPQQIDKVLRFAYLSSPIRDVLRILKDRGFAPVLASYDPVATTDLLMPWLERSASQSVSAPARGQGGKTVDAFARAMRSRTSAALLFANLSNTIQNVTGLAPAALRAGKGNVVRSMWAYLRDPMGSAEAVDGASLMMRNRADTQLDDMRQAIEEIVLNPNPYQKVQTFFARHAQFMQIGLQNVLDRVVWMAAYDKAVADNEQDPVRFADSVVRTTMGSFTPEDATRFESGPTWARPLTLFAGYFIGQANLLGTEFAKATAAKKWGRGLEVYALGIAIPAIAAQVIAMAFRGDSGDGDDDGLDMGDIFKVFFGAQFGYMAAMVPVIGPVVNSALNRFNDKPYDDKISLSPVASMLEATAGVPKDLHDLFTDKANWSRTIKDVATAATLATGIPFTLAAKPVSYIAGVAEGRIEPTGPGDVARGLVTGVASPQSKQQ